MTDLKLFLTPTYRGRDEGDGGIRRVVEAQQKWLPQHGIIPIESLAGADMVASHATQLPDVPVDRPWVVHCHGLYWADYDWGAGWYQHANKDVTEALRRADHVTAPSEWVAYALQRGMWLKPTVLHHGIEPAEWVGGSSKGYVLWNKARQDVYSDPTPVNEVASLDRSIEYISTFGRVAPNVHITGRLPYEEAKDYVRFAGVYLCTARETFGIGTLEAMAAGVPVVGWAWGGQLEILKHKETGWLARPGDHEGLLEGIRWALANRQEVGDRARADVLDRFTWEKVMARYAQLYRAVYEKHQSLLKGPKVSVIVPCYNLGKYLPDTLRSLQGQTMPDWEAIVVDDASTDDSPKVAKAFSEQDSRIRYIRNERNRHVSFTRNRGMAESKGRYLVPLDADDMLTPNALELLADALDKDRSIQLAYGGLRIMHEDGTVRAGVHDWPPAFDFRQQITGNHQVPTMTMFRRAVWERTGGYRERNNPSEDADFWTRVASVGFKLAKVTDAPTLLYRVRPNSLSRELPWQPWLGWYPWSREMVLTPWGVAMDPPARIGAMWPVPSCLPPKIAVIIPVGPGHEVLAIDAIDSVEAQSYRQWECIVVNDTGDPTFSVPQPWAKVIHTAGKIGPAAARNLGIRHSTAPLFVPLDADDYLEPEALSKFLEAYESYGGVVYSQWWDDKGSEVSLYDPPEYDASLLTRLGCIHAVTALYPRSAWKEIGGFDEGLSHWEDWDFQLKLAQKGICGTKVDQPLFVYRKTTGARREENYAAFEKGKEAILRKWQRVWDGREVLMACRSCPGGGGGKKAAPPPQNNSAPAPEMTMSSGAVLLEYHGASPGLTFKGKGTGQTYRFGHGAMRQKYVLGPDVDALMTLRDRGAPMFTRAVERPPEPSVAEGPVIMAISPPVHTAPEPTPTSPLGEPESEGALTLQQVRQMLSGMSVEDMNVMLAKERAAKNRASVVKLLETAIAKEAEAVGVA